ncbi:glycerophosphodiester phosphodiesterase [Amnibacterium flavum]|uniref:GP-PDE domain-containing protein n=1 Tax=Amnibacterium flavum TaxID=2173173 RepID=A0A2V1HUB5_9MICO|nr:glycerophosphodiester phosphodiesterase family protein [Amnibacterium flavum]PVZ95891.1 hypothetical protein DDQ50_05345 [Amnibacterium flavum]
MAQRPSASRSAFSRRGFLLIGGSTLLLAACAPTPAPPRPSPTAASPTPPPAPTGGPYTIDSLLETSPFFIAHRGSGDNWVEHTYDAYANSVIAGAKAIEVSVSRTSDGVFVCHHDKNLARLTGVDLDIGDATWEQLSTLQNDARPWLGPLAALQPIPRLDDVLAAFASTHVIFLEDKQGTNTAELLDLMEQWDPDHIRFVWKQWAGAQQYQAVAKRGFRTWGYFTPDSLGRLAELAPRFDMLGIPVDASDADMSAFAAIGKPVIAWEVRRRSQRDRLVSLGVVGMMCADIPYLFTEEPASDADAFASGLRSAGDLPDVIGSDWSQQPYIDPASATLRMSPGQTATYVLGSLSPAAADATKVSLELRWPDAGPSGGAAAGFSFGAGDDNPRPAGSPDAVTVLVGASGTVSVAQGGRTLAALESSAPRAGEWIGLTVALFGGGATLTRDSDSSKSVTAPGIASELGYVSLLRSAPSDPAVEFRRVSVV